MKKLKILLVFCSLNRTFVPEMSNIRKTNLILALVSVVLAALCVLSIMKS